MSTSSPEQRRWPADASDAGEPRLAPVAAPMAAPALAGPDRLAALHESGLLELEEGEAFARLARLTARVLGTPMAFVSVVDAERRIVLGAAAPHDAPLTHSFCAQVVERGGAVVVEDARNVARLGGGAAPADANVVAYAGMPLTTREGQTLGALSAVDVRPREWSQEDLDTLADLAAGVTAEIERQGLARRLELEVRRDAVTGLRNRLAWDDQAPRELARARRLGRPLVVVLVALERNRRARAKGDELLRDVAARWSEALRDVDLLIRMGGDEFAVLLPTTALDPAFDVVDRLRHSLPGGVGCAAGLAILRDDEGPAGLLARSEAALARARRTGRNASSLAS